MTTRTININEYGVEFAFSTGYDMSAYSTLSLDFTKPDETHLIVTNPSVTVGVGNLVTTEGTFLANKYVLYTFQSGDLNVAGTWCAKLTYTDASPKRLVADVTHFTVGANEC